MINFSAVSHNLLNFLSQLIQLEWFLNEAVASTLQNFGRLAVNAIPAGKQNFYLRIDFSEAVKGFTTAHSGHDHIHDDQIYFTLVCSKYINRLTAAQRRHH